MRAIVCTWNLCYRKLSTQHNKMSSTENTQVSLNDNQVVNNCSLCMKIFTDPKILPCFHSYCASCLHSYTCQHTHNGKFSCPLCGVECRLPSGGVDSIQTNFYIKAALKKSSIAANSPCDVCDGGMKADNSCLECEQNLCITCSRGHLRMTSSKEHHLVSLTDRQMVGEGQVMSKAFCEKHKGEELIFYCQKCCIPVCLRCKITMHEQHTTRDLSDIASDTRTELKETLKSAQNLLPTLHHHMNDVTAYDSHLTTEGKKLQEDIAHQTKKLHTSIDTISQKMIDSIDDEMNIEAARLGVRRGEISDKTTALSAQLHSANQVVSYVGDAEITRNKDGIAEQLKRMGKAKPVTSMVRLYMDFVPGLTKDGLGDLFGNLNRMREPDEKVTVKEFSSFNVDSNVRAISSICTMNDGTAWIALGWTTKAHTFSRSGTKMTTHDVGKTIDFITKDSTGMLYVSSNENQMVGRPGLDFKLDEFATFQGYHPRGMTFCPDGDLLICLPQSSAYQDYRPSHKNKISRVNTVGRTITDYGADGKHFIYPLRVAVNVNADICLSDCKKPSVVILKPNGDVKSVYDGSEAVGLKKTFEPRGIVCDSRGHILVADSANNSIHLLDHNGKFMRFITTEKDGLLGPYAISLDTEDYLWVGGRDAEVKVFKLHWA